MIGALGVKTGNVDFIKTGSSGSVDFIIVVYSVKNSNIVSNNQYRFQGNIFKNSCV
jgi:hypothetical protein